MRVGALGICLCLTAARPSFEDDEHGDDGHAELTIALAHHGVDKPQRVAIVRSLTRALGDDLTLILPKRLAREGKRISRDRSRRQRLSTAARRLGADFVLDLHLKDMDDGSQVIQAALYESDTGDVRTSWIVENPKREYDAKDLGARIAQSTLRSRAKLVSTARAKRKSDVERTRTKAKRIDAVSAVAFQVSDEAFVPDEFSSLSAGFGTVLQPAQIVEPSVSASGPLFAAGPFEVDAGARLSVESFSYFDSTRESVGEGRTTKRMSSDLAAHVEAKSEIATFYTRLLLRRDFTERTRNRLEPEQLWARLDAWPFEILAGRTYASWGRANLANPADILNPTDFRDFIASEKLSQWMMRAALTTGSLRFEVYYLPVFSPDLVPAPTRADEIGRLVSDSRWVNGSLPTMRSDGNLNSYEFIPAPDSEKSWKNGTIAFRTSASLGSVDAALGWAYGLDTFESNISPTPPFDMETRTFHTTITTRHLPRHAFTLDAEKAIGNLRFVGEALLAIPIAPSSAGDYDVGTFRHLTMVLGADYILNDIMPGHQLQLFFEVTGTQLLDGEFPKRQSEPEYATARARFPFPLAVMSRAAWSYAGYGQLSLTAMANIGQYFQSGRLTIDGRPNEPGPDLYLRPELKVALFQHFDAKLGLDLMLGQKDEFFGSFGHNTRFTLALAASL